MMSYRAEYGSLLDDIAKEADAIAMKYFRTDSMRVERKGDGTAITQADRAVEEMARAKVTASGLALDVLGEEMSVSAENSPRSGKGARLIIDPIDGTEELWRGWRARRDWRAAGGRIAERARIAMGNGFTSRTSQN